MPLSIWFRKTLSAVFLRQVYIPLVVVLVVSVVLHKLLGWEGFFLNLATEIIGIIVTVAYVDWIVRKRESERWQGALVRVSSRLKLFAHASMRNLNHSIGISGVDIFRRIPFAEIREGDSLKRDIAWSKSIRGFVETEVESRVLNLDENRWNKLGRALFHTYTEADKFLDLFGTRIKPEHYKLLLDIQDEARIAAIEFYQEFPDVIGAPNQFLDDPKKEFSAIEKRVKEETSKRTKSILEQLLELDEQVRLP